MKKPISILLLLLLLIPQLHAGVKVSDLPAASSIGSSDILAVVTSSTTKKITLAKHQYARRLSSISDDSLFVLLAAIEQMLVQVREVAHVWNRNKMVPAKISAFTFHASFFVSFFWIAELGLKSPVRPERDKTLRFLTPMST